MSEHEVPDFETTPAHCEKCGAAFEAKVWRIENRLWPLRTCDQCTAALCAAREAEGLARRTQEREERWATICPVEFRLTTESGGHTDEGQLNAEQPLVGQLMVEWQYGPRGLLLHGVTGRCKTRCAWRLLRREFDNGRRVKAIKGIRFGTDVQYYSLEGGLRGWLNSLIAADLLLIDDFGKGKFTDAAEAHLFAVVDERSEQGRPNIITTNDTAETLRKRMSDGRWEALIRRLHDYCQPFDFDEVP